MVKKLMWLVCIFGVFVALHAADDECKKRVKAGIENAYKQPLYASTPARGSDAARRRESAPARLSDEGKRDEGATVIPLESSEQEEKLAKPFYSSSPVQRSKFVSQREVSKKLCLIATDWYDDFLVQTVDQNRKDIKQIAVKYNLKNSKFYSIIRAMRIDDTHANAHINLLTNYFLFTLLPKKACKDFLSSNVDALSTNPHLDECISLIRGHLHMVTEQAIKWPSISREEDKDAYYKQLLEKNQNINVLDVGFIYRGATIAIYCLSLINPRSPELKKRLLEIANSKTLMERHLRVVQERLCAMACSVPNLNFFCREKRRS